MSVITNGLLGQGSGLSFSAQGTNIQNPTTTAQANTAYNSAQNALTQQQNFLAATQAQNGLGNQSNVYNQLGNIAAGQGPNPAQAMLAQSTGANTANQAALMAGQRGASQNAGLIARQAAQQGGANQQAAAGQAATMQANQSLGALQQQAGIAGQQAAQQAAATGANTGAAQGEQQTLLNSITGQNNANVGMQSNINSVQGSLANTAATGQMNLLGNITGAAGSAAGLAEGGRVGYDAGGYVAQAPMSDAQWNALTPTTGAPTQPTAPQAPAPPTTAGPKSKVGNVFAGNSQTAQNPLTGTAQAGSTIGTAIGTGLKNLFSSSPQSDTYNMSPDAQQEAYLHADSALPSTEQEMPASNDVMPMAAKGGKVPAMVSPGEKYLNPQEAKAAKAGANPMNLGETIPGKPKVKGAINSYANDTVDKDLDEGGLVLPRSVTQSRNPEWAAHAFVRAHMAKGGMVSGLHSKSKKKK